VEIGNETPPNVPLDGEALLWKAFDYDFCLKVMLVSQISHE
jgi:hypothetical protein